MTAARTRRASRVFLALLVTVYVLKQIAVALVSPPFSGHDEVAHFAGVRTVATQHRMPTLWQDTLPHDLFQYRAFTIEWRDRDRSPLYTAVHPPLYYGLMAGIYRLARRHSPETIQYILRCASIPFGVITVIVAYLLTRALFPSDAFLLVTVPAVVALQPQVSYEAAMVNNDALATALYSVVVYALVITIRDGSSLRRAAGIGALTGAALLAKGNAIVAMVLIPIAFWAASRRLRPSRHVIAHTLAAYGVVLAVAGPWWWFMARTYGDPLGLAALAAIQPDLTRSDATFLQLLFSGRFFVDRWNESWGQFGWRLIHISPALVTLLALGAAVCVAGLTLRVLQPRPASEDQRWRLAALALLALACALSYAGMVQFGVKFVLTQARYFFPVVDAAALLLMLGLRTWIPPARRALGQVGVVTLFVAVNLVIYVGYVVPFWYPR